MVDVINKQPRIDATSTKVIVDDLGGSRNAEWEKGNFIVAKSRVISGNYNRIAILGKALKDMGIDVDADVANIFAATIGFSKEVPPNGMRGELIEVITGQELPKTEKIKEGGTEILKRPPQETQSSG